MPRLHASSLPPMDLKFQDLPKDIQDKAMCDPQFMPFYMLQYKYPEWPYSKVESVFEDRAMEVVNRLLLRECQNYGIPIEEGRRRALEMCKKKAQDYEPDIDGGISGLGPPPGQAYWDEKAAASLSKKIASAVAAVKAKEDHVRATRERKLQKKKLQMQFQSRTSEMKRKMGRRSVKLGKAQAQARQDMRNRQAVRDLERLSVASEVFREWVGYIALRAACAAFFGAVCLCMAELGKVLFG